MRYHNPLIAVTNESSAVTDDQVMDAMTAWQHQISYHFKPHWDTAATLVWHPNDAPDVPYAWPLGIFDHSDQPGALGYHWRTKYGMPVMFAFAADDIADGLDWSVTVTHEILETLGDPFADLAVQVGKEEFWAYENCDAVEADPLGYEINGWRVSDFVFRNWFIAGSPGPWDYKGHLSRPLEILDGGYIGSWTPASGWKQRTEGRARHAAGPRLMLRQMGGARGPLREVVDWSVAGAAQPIA